MTHRHRINKGFNPMETKAVDPLTPEEVSEIQNRYQNANNAERTLMNDIFALIDDPKQLVHFFRGAQLEIVEPTRIGEKKNNNYYTKWSKFKPLKDRSASSSHQSDQPQWSVQGPLVTECLFGARQKNEKNCTWVQLESHSTDPSQLLGHLASYITYRLTGENVGPYGRSKHTEANPLILHHPSDKTLIKNRQQFWHMLVFKHPAEVTHQLLIFYENIIKKKEHLRFPTALREEKARLKREKQLETPSQKKHPTIK